METKTRHISKKKTLKITDLPAVNFSHIQNLTDDTGIMQHAAFNMPNRKEGYCLDDNARALLLFVLACKYTRNNSMQLQLLHVYSSFIHHMQAVDGAFKNFMSPAKEVTEECASEDSFSRTMMALGFLMNEGPSNIFSKTATGIFSRAYRHIDKLISIRGIANTVIG